MYLNGFACSEQEVITMDYRGAIPIYGSYINYQKLSDESLSFDERLSVALGAGVMGGIHMYVASEVGALSLGQARLMQATAANAPMGIMVAALATLTYATTKPGATVQTDREFEWQPVTVVPKLGIF